MKISLYNFVADSVENYHLNLRPYSFNPKSVVPYYVGFS